MFDGYRDPSEEESKELVDRYEKLISEHHVPFFDSAQYEQIVEFYLLNDQLVKARRVVDRALEQYPFYTNFILHRAQLHIYDSRLEEALELIERVKLLEPSNPEVFVLLGNAFDEMGRYEEAIDAYQDALNFDCDKDEIYLYMAYTYENWDKYDEAIGVLKQALEYNADNIQALSELAFCCDFNNNDEIIEGFLQQFIDDNPYSYMAWYCLGSIYYKKDQYADALYCLDYAALINEKYIPAHLNMGNIYFVQEMYDDAIECFQKILELSHDDIFALCYIANCYKFQENTRKAREYYKKAIKVDPAYADAWYGLGASYEIDGNYSQAIEYFKKAIDKDKDDHNYWFSLAETYAQTDNVEKAYEAYQKCLELDPECADYVRGFALFLLDFGYEEEAARLIKEALENEERNPTFQLLMAGFLMKRELWHEAVFYLADARDELISAKDLFLEMFPEFEDHYLLEEIFNS